MPSKVIDLVFGSLIHGMNQMDKGVLAHGLNVLSESEQDALLKRYLSIYHAKTLAQVLRRH